MQGITPFVEREKKTTGNEQNKQRKGGMDKTRKENNTSRA